MRRVRVILAAIGALALASAASAQQAGGEPRALIESIYQQYIKSGPTGAQTPNQFTRSWYSKAIRARMDKLDKACKKAEEPCGPEADFLVDGQDYDIKAVAVKELSRKDGKAMVEARFKNSGDDRTMLFTMVRENDRWVIDELFGKSKEQPKGYKLSQILKP